MSKEIKMSNAFVLPLFVSTTNPQMTTAKPSLNGRIDYHSTTIRSPSELEITHAVHAINNHDRLVDEVAALREALRLKETECEALEGDVIEWHETKETMPPIGCPVMAIGGALDEARIISRESDGNFDLWCWLNGDICEWDDREQPTHWMPLPELGGGDE